MTETINENQQYKLDGKCSLCHRQKYCSKPCKKAIERRNFQISSAIYSAMDRRMGGALSTIMSRTL